MKIGLIEVSGIKRVVINRRLIYVRDEIYPGPVTYTGLWMGSVWLQVSEHDLRKASVIRELDDHQMMMRIRSYLSGKKLRRYRIFVSGDTINIVRREISESGATHEGNHHA